MIQVKDFYDSLLRVLFARLIRFVENIIFAKLEYPIWRSRKGNEPMNSEVIRVYSKLTVRVVTSCFLLHVVPVREPFLTPFYPGKLSAV